MKGQELIIKFQDDLAFLTDEVALDFNQVQIADSPVTFKAAAFWKVQVITYVENEQKLFVEVLSYEVGVTEFPNNQIELADILISIEKVAFKNIYTIGLLKTLNSKVPLKISQPKQETVYRGETPIQPQAKFERQPVQEIYNEPFFVSIKDVTFLSGKVAFKKKILPLKQLIEFEIFNENIIQEYDAVKNYFANILKTKKIQVIPSIITTDDVVTSISATSSEITRIDKTFIEEIKFEVIKGRRGKEFLGSKQLFTIDEYLETFTTEDFNVKQFFKSDNDFFENLLERSETKHYKHLRFLSSKHSADIQKLRFVHKPFSFVFLLKGAEKFHIVWETLDTQEATYIWSVDNDVNDLRHALAQKDTIISLIISEGKNEYINRNEENFNRVFHDYTDLQNGFKNWKNEIEKIIL